MADFDVMEKSWIFKLFQVSRLKADLPPANCD